MEKKPAFTLIEILVVVGVLTVLVVSVGGIMGMTFKAKNTSEGNELLSSKAVYVLNELKRNILNAKPDKFTCNHAVGATGISFETKDGGSTTLSCILDDKQIASSSANGTFEYLEENFIVNCANFVRCTKVGTKVTKVEFKLNIGISTNVPGAGTTGVYYQVVAPRE